MEVFFIYAGKRGSNLECAIALHEAAGQLGLGSHLVISKDNPRAGRVKALYSETLVCDFFSVGEMLRLRKRLGGGIAFFTMISPKMMPLFLSLSSKKAIYFHATFDYSFSRKKPGDYLMDFLHGLTIQGSTLAVATQYPLAWQIRLKLGKEAEVLPHPPYSGIKKRFFTGEKEVVLPFKDYFLDFGGIDRPSKGTDVLLKAMEKGGFKVVLAGKRKGIAQREGLMHIDRWTSDEELNWLVKNAKCVVLPYLVSSQFSGCLALAYHFKKPVLAPFSPAFEHLIDEGRTGWFFSQGDWEDLGEKMRKISEGRLTWSADAIAQKEAQMEALTKKGLERILRRAVRG